MSNCSHQEKDGHLGTSWRLLILTNPPISEPKWSVFTYYGLHVVLYIAGFIFKPVSGFVERLLT